MFHHGNINVNAMTFTLKIFYLTFFALLFIIHHYGATNQPEFNSKVSKHSAATKPPRKITGGTNCSVERYPFFVSIRRLTSLNHFCGGSLIRRDWVITAAHCVAIYMGSPELFTVIAGRSTSDQLGVQRMRVKGIYVHPEFDENTYDNDIALMFLEHGFLITDVVRTVEIPHEVIIADVVTVCPEATSIGWGWHDQSKVNHIENGSIPHVPVMQCVSHLPVLSHAQCQTARGGLSLISTTFCTMVPTRKDICQGDSGGPLLCNNIQYGIVSNGYSCNEAIDIPGYYMRIDRVLNFIKECINGEINYARDMNPRGLDQNNFTPKIASSDLMISLCFILAMRQLYRNK